MRIAAALADGNLFVRDAQQARVLSGRSGVVEAELMKALERWEVLEGA